MTEDDAQNWLTSELGVSRETFERLSILVEVVQAEADQQNLISRATIPHLWARHIVDSAQLLKFVSDVAAPWADLGTGAGFPGLVAAILHEGPVTLIEERRLRVEFLRRAAQEVCVQVDVIGSKLERVEPRPFGIISARAFAPLPKLLELAAPFATESTIWLLPKGRNAKTELEEVRGAWQGDFRLEPSLTDPEAHIIVATGIVKRAGGKRR